MTVQWNGYRYLHWRRAVSDHRQQTGLTIIWILKSSQQLFPPPNIFSFCSSPHLVRLETTRMQAPEKWKGNVNISNPIEIKTMDNCHKAECSHSEKSSLESYLATQKGTKSKRTLIYHKECLVHCRDWILLSLLVSHGIGWIDNLKQHFSSIKVNDLSPALMLSCDIGVLKIFYAVP